MNPENTPSLFQFTREGSLPLHNWDSVRLHLYWAYEGAPEYRRGSETVTSQTAWMLRQGHVRFRWREQTLTLRTGQWVILGKNRGEHEFSEDAELISVCFRAEWLSGQSLFDDSEPIVLHARTCPELEASVHPLLGKARIISREQTTRLFVSSCTPLEFLQLRIAFLSWLEVLTREIQNAGGHLRISSSSDERVLKGIRLLDEWPLHEPFCEQELADLIGLSPSHLNRLFGIDLGLSPKVYYERRRFRVARELLLADQTAVKTIAYKLGFHDPSHFSNWFRNQAQVTPTHFRSLRVKPWDLS
ncbi:MAG: AraC family transcriptional regulator [Kiritimatiellae bacterium]|jgi:AraC-like DNA-binding protein|nr:AraC family transcriptional regulator [Kiritimatiellia bacterium]